MKTSRAERERVLASLDASLKRAGVEPAKRGGFSYETRKAALSEARKTVAFLEKWKAAGYPAGLLRMVATTAEERLAVAKGEKPKERPREKNCATFAADYHVKR